MRKIFFGALCGLLFLGCSSLNKNVNTNTVSKLNDMNGINWVLSEINGERANIVIVDGQVVGVPTLSFNGTNVHGNSGVNSFSASYVFADGDFKTTVFITTLMAAFNPILMNTENTIFEILGASDKKIEIKENTLIIKSSRGELLYTKENLIKNSSWVLMNISESSDESLEKENFKVPTLHISSDSFYGNAGVNNFNAKYKIFSNNGLKVSPIMSTKMAGSLEATKVENKFIKILSNATSFNFPLSGVLIVESSHGNLTFKEEMFQVGVLNNSVWNLVSIGETAITSTEENYAPTLQFKDNLFFGSSGVNSFTGQYALEFRNIYFSNTALTMKMGEEKFMKMEYRYLKALSNALYIEVKNNEVLTIHTKDETLIFNRVYM